MSEIEVVAVNRSEGFLLLADGRVCKVSTWIDGDGDETEDAGAAVFAVAPVGERWLSVDLRGFTRTSEVH